MRCRYCTHDKTVSQLLSAISYTELAAISTQLNHRDLLVLFLKRL